MSVCTVILFNTQLYKSNTVILSLATKTEYTICIHMLTSFEKLLKKYLTLYQSSRVPTYAGKPHWISSPTP